MVTQPEKTTNFIKYEHAPLDKKTRGISCDMLEGCDNSALFVNIKNAQSVRLEIKLAHTFCFLVMLSPSFANTIPLVEKLSKQYKIAKNSPANAF